MYTIYVDTTDLQARMKEMQKALSHEGFVRLMRWTFTDVGRTARRLIYEAVREEYVASRGFITSGIQNPKVTIGGGGVSCIIPLAGPRGTIGKDYRASGGARGWKIRRYKVKAKIVVAGTSVMPPQMSSYGGQPAFRNLSWNKIAFTRAGKGRLPIMKVVGIAMPQMPLNRSEDSTVEKLFNKTSERLEHNFMRLFG